MMIRAATTDPFSLADAAAVVTGLLVIGAVVFCISMCARRTHRRSPIFYTARRVKRMRPAFTSCSALSMNRNRLRIFLRAPNARLRTRPDSEPDGQIGAGFDGHQAR